MRLTRFDNVATFRARAEPFLLAHEAAHCLQLGILATLSQQSAEYPLPPYLALVEEGEHVAAVALRTPPFNLVLSLLREDAPQAAALDVIAADLAPLQQDLPGVLGPAPLSLAFAETWQRRTGRAFQPGKRDRIYELTAVRGVSGVLGHLRAATAADHDLLVTWVDAFFIEAAPEPGPFDAEIWVEHLFASPLRGAYLWEDGGPVSLACSGGPTPNGIRIGPVYTPPERRGHGYASAATAALSQLLLERGRRFCFLFTDLANPTSNHIYQTIGYQPVCDVDIYHFTQAR
jgi:predicted GNAT family acetyltransferase